MDSLKKKGMRDTFATQPFFLIPVKRTYFVEVSFFQSI